MRRLGYTFLVTGMLLTIVQLFIYTDTLPETVASHFGIEGRADGWMPKSNFLWLHAGIQATTAGLLISIARYGRYLPDSLLNMPHKDYWLKGDRRKPTLDYTEALLTLIAGLTAVFLTATFQLAYQANVDGTEQLSTAWFLPLVVGYVALVFTLAIQALLRFSRRPQLD